MTDYPVEIPDILPNSRRELFPYGQRSDRLSSLVACRDHVHLQKVVKAFPLPGAMYTTIGANIAGRRWIKAIVFDVHTSDPVYRGQVDQWIVNHVYACMLPQYKDEVYVI